MISDNMLLVRPDGRADNLDRVFSGLRWDHDAIAIDPTIASERTRRPKEILVRVELWPPHAEGDAVAVAIRRVQNRPQDQAISHVNFRHAAMDERAAIVQDPRVDRGAGAFGKNLLAVSGIEPFQPNLRRPALAALPDYGRKELALARMNQRDLCREPMI